MITIREMDISDYDSVIDLWCQTESLSLRDVDSKQSIESYLNRNSGLSFVALSGNKLLVRYSLGPMVAEGICNIWLFHQNFEAKK